MIEREVCTRSSINEKLSSMGDYVKIDYLTRCLGEAINFDTKKFVMFKLAEIYEDKGMFLEAARMMKSGADLNSTFDGKVKDYVKSAEFFIRAGIFDDAESCINKANACASTSQKVAIKIAKKDFYKEYAEECIKKDRRKHAMGAYEKLLALDLDFFEKKEIQERLLKIYEKLGKIREFYNLKKSM